MSGAKPVPMRAEQIFFAGLAGEAFFEFYAWVLSALLFGATLQPAILVNALSIKLFGAALPYWIAFSGHFLVGAMLFPLLVLAVHLISRLGLILSGLLAGVLLWFIAQGILAPVVGRSFMMGFGSYTQSSFLGHVGMTLVIALTFALLRRKNEARVTAC